MTNHQYSKVNCRHSLTESYLKVTMTIIRSLTAITALMASIATSDSLEGLRSATCTAQPSQGKFAETGLKHHPRQLLTKEEVDALNSLVYARTDLIKITSVLSKKTEEEKLKLFRTEKFMIWWIRSSAELIQHWYSIEENISSPVLTKERSEP